MLFSIETGNKLVTLFGVKVIWQYEVGGAISVNRAYDKSNGDKPTSIVVWLTTGEKGAMEFPLIIVGVVGYEVRESKQDVVRY